MLTATVPAVRLPASPRDDRRVEQLGVIAAAAGTFAGTDIDDLVILTVLFLAARAGGRPRPGQIWAGQYAGIAVLVGVSILAALGLGVVPDRWVGLLGLVPLALGIRGFVLAIRRADEDEPKPVAGSWPAVAGVTIANGADNISVYTPIFRTLSPAAGGITVAVFAVLVAAWLLLAAWIGSHRRVIDVVERYGHWIVPGVFVLIGLVILFA
jgi:cadmium resistance protein CadD (predicted permease)